MPARRARAVVFGAASRLGDRDAALACTAGELAIPADELLDALFADLPFEKVLCAPDRPPCPALLAQRLVFPDFELCHRRHPERRWLLEIAGFWTPGYVADKLRRLRALDRAGFILCIDEERNCASQELPARAEVIRYRRHVPAEAVLRIIERAGP